MPKRSATRTIARTRGTLADCLSLPNTIGNGPIRITPPPCPFGLPVRNKGTSVASKTSTNPAKTRTVPIETTPWSGNLDPSANYDFPALLLVSFK